MFSYMQSRCVRLICLLSTHRSGCIAGVLEAAKKGTLKVDLQALTVGAALLTMHRCDIHLSVNCASYSTLRIAAA